nr:hypothetical protein [uncultured Carboxylicivirga sp.]
MHKLFLFFLSLFFYNYSISQIIKADTVYGEDGFKFITVLNSKGSFQKVIENGDTTVMQAELLYQMYLGELQQDSMNTVINNFLETPEYKGRDTINTEKLEYLYIKESYEMQSSWHTINYYRYLIFDNVIKKEPKGIIYGLRCDNKRNIINCLSDTITKQTAYEIIELLNDHMAFNSVPYMQYPNAVYMNPPVASEVFYIEIILKEKNKPEFIRKISPNKSWCFGLHEKIQLGLEKLWHEKLTIGKASNNIDFIIKNERKLRQKEVVEEIKSYTFKDE